ncbi:helix-turn-helix domain-containing protein [Micromonospora fulviviridis]|uniref:helix-turn-helix domain-containing protein n=1 Tax=Micromonospora fulviviridis TaxID=47860 RepID=UPI0037BA4182
MDVYLTVDEVAQAIRVSPKTVYRMVAAGELPRINLGKGKRKPRIRIRQSAVEAYMASRENGQAA